MVFFFFFFFNLLTVLESVMRQESVGGRTKMVTLWYPVNKEGPGPCIPLKDMPHKLTSFTDPSY